MRGHIAKKKEEGGKSTSTNKRSGCDLCCDASFARYIDKTGGREEKKCVIEFDSGDDVVGNVKTVSVSLAGYDSSVAANFRPKGFERGKEEDTKSGWKETSSSGGVNRSRTITGFSMYPGILV